MRTALAIIMLTFFLGLVSRPIPGQMRAGDTSALDDIHMIDRHTGWAITSRSHVGVCGRESCLLRTTDGGSQWRDVTPTSSSGQRFRVSRISALSSLIAWVLPVAEFDSNAQILSTADGGRTWKSAAIPPPAGFTGVRASSISFINHREGWLIVFLDAYSGHEEDEIYHSSDGGETWTKVASATREDDSSGLPITGDKDAITFLNPTTGWITGGTIEADWLYVYVTHDGARTWQQQVMPLPKGLTPHWNAFPKPPKFFMAREGILPVYYSLRNSSSQSMIVGFYVTHDSGTTWTYTTPGPVGASEVAHGAADMNHLWVMQGNVVYATTDGGRQWTTIPRNPLFASVIQMDFISPQVGWALRYEFPFLLRTLDGGRTWAPITYAVSR
jgi:photosystem II stability/assembly factor-like uncharacterized protein